MFQNIQSCRFELAFYLLSTLRSVASLRPQAVRESAHVSFNETDLSWENRAITLAHENADYLSNKPPGKRNHKRSTHIAGSLRQSVASLSKNRRAPSSCTRFLSRTPKVQVQPRRHELLNHKHRKPCARESARKGLPSQKPQLGVHTKPRHAEPRPRAQYAAEFNYGRNCVAPALYGLPYFPNVSTARAGIPKCAKSDAGSVAAEWTPRAHYEPTEPYPSGHFDCKLDLRSCRVIGIVTTATVLSFPRNAGCRNGSPAGGPSARERERTTSGQLSLAADSGK